MPPCGRPNQTVVVEFVRVDAQMSAIGWRCQRTHLEGGFDELHLTQHVLGAQTIPSGQRIPQGVALHVHRVQPGGLVWPPAFLERLQRLHIHLVHRVCSRTHHSMLKMIADP